MNKIIFFRYLPLTYKVFVDFCMKELGSSGYAVEYWDLTSLFFSKSEIIEEYIPSNKGDITVIHITSKSELRKRIETNQSSLYICLMTLEFKLLYIFRYLTIYKCKTAVFSYWPLPLITSTNENRILDLIKRYDLGKIMSGIKNRILLPLAIKSHYINFYDYCFIGGDEGWRGIGIANKKFLKKTKIYPFSYWDYNNCLKAKDEMKHEDFIVFLDEYYPFHPDLLLFNRQAVDAETYFKDMNKVFKALEDFYGLPVVIAAHPKALLYKKRNYYDGRKVEYNNTMRLVAKASLVLAHDSLSLSYAIIFMKPIIFLNSEEIKIKTIDNYKTIEGFANRLNSPMLFAENIDLSVLPNKLELSDRTKAIYKEISKRYYTSVEGNVTNETLLLKYLREIFEESVN